MQPEASCPKAVRSFKETDHSGAPTTHQGSAPAEQGGAGDGNEPRNGNEGGGSGGEGGGNGGDGARRNNQRRGRRRGRNGKLGKRGPTSGLHKARTLFPIPNAGMEGQAGLRRRRTGPRPAPAQISCQ